MYLMSSLSKRFSTTVVPSLNAESKRIRFESDLLPGNTICNLINVDFQIKKNKFY